MGGGAILGFPVLLDASESVLLETAVAFIPESALFGTVVVAPPGVDVEVSNGGIDEELKDAGAPSSLAGMAEPIPLLVHGVGIGKLNVFGWSTLSP